MKGDDKCLSCSTTGKGISLSTNGSGSARKGSVVSPAPSWWRTPEGSGLGLRTRPPAGPPSIATRTRQRMKRFTKKRTAQQQHTHTQHSQHTTHNKPHTTQRNYTHTTQQNHTHTRKKVEHAHRARCLRQCAELLGCAGLGAQHGSRGAGGHLPQPCATKRGESGRQVRG